MTSYFLAKSGDTFRMYRNDQLSFILCHKEDQSAIDLIERMISELPLSGGAETIPELPLSGRIWTLTFDQAAAIHYAASHDPRMIQLSTEDLMDELRRRLKDTLEFSLIERTDTLEYRKHLREKDAKDTYIRKLATDAGHFDTDKT